MFRGVNVLANAVKATLGPKGRNAITLQDSKAISQVATISANADQAVGSIIADEMEKG